jgi:dienelactone hydrolase
MDNTGAASRWFDAIVERIDFRDSWLSGRFSNFADWRSHARAVLIDLFGAMPQPVPFETEELGIEERATYSVRLVRFNIHAAFRTEAYILMPHGDGPFPGIVALHDHGGFFLWGKEKLVRTSDADHPALAKHVRQLYDGRYIADELAARGYAVIVIDAWHWGKQRVPDVAGARDLDLSTAEGVAAYHALFPDFERRTINALIYGGSSRPGDLLHADRRALDLFLEDRRVDAQRIGCIGLSVGGFRSFHLAGMDGRIRAAVVVGWMCALAPYLRLSDQLYGNPHGLGPGLFTPGMTRHLDFPDIASLACPHPLLVIAGRQDSLFPVPSVDAAFDKLRVVYASQHASERLETHWYGAPHCFSLPMQSLAFDWLDRWLQKDRRR